MANRLPTKSIVHPEPGLTTVKQLYYTARRCAKPGCREPLFRVNSDTGKTVLNSRVAHIHARRELGPRWQPGMSGEENSSPDNLLLLCIPHSYEIDATPKHFPVPLLHQWKSAQVAEDQKGWEITEEDAETIVADSFSLEDVVEAVAERMPFSPRQRPRTESLELAARRASVARSGRLGLLVPAREAEVLRWMAEDPDPAVPARDGDFRVLIGPMGSGKTERAWQWFEAGLQEAYDDDAVATPLWFEGYEVERGLEGAVRAHLDGDPKPRCRVVLNDVDRLSPSSTRNLVAAARALVGVWPNMTVLATAQSESAIEPGEVIPVEPWSVRRGADLVQTALGTEPPWRTWGPETTELVQRPLTALALAARLAAGGDVATSRFELLRGLPESIIEGRRPDTAGSQVWEELARLAILILQARSAVRSVAFGNPPRIWQVTGTGLVLEREGRLSFALPVFEHHFGAEALVSGAFDIGKAADRESFPAWRYAIVNAIIAAPDVATRQRLLSSVARSNPAALSWILEEVEPASPTRSSPAFGGPGAFADPADGPDAEASEQESVAAGLELRSAFEALAEGFGPLAPAVAFHSRGRLTQWGSALGYGRMTLAMHREETEPAVVTLAQDHMSSHPLAQGWRYSTQFAAPAGDFGRWYRARDLIRPRLARALKRRALSTSPDSRLTAERMWTLSCVLMNRNSPRPHRGPIPVQELGGKVEALMEEVNRAVTYSYGAIDGTDIRWLDEQLVRFDGEFLEDSWRCEDSAVLPRQPGSQAYSAEPLAELTARSLADAVTGYRDLVEQNFPRFGTALGLYSILPVRIEGTITHPAQPGLLYDIGLNFAWIPIPDAGRGTPTAVELRTQTYPGVGPYWHTPLGPRPASRTAFHLPMLEDGPLPLASARPAGDLAYEWLARDLQELGWLTHHLRHFG